MGSFQGTQKGTCNNASAPINGLLGLVPANLACVPGGEHVIGGIRRNMPVQGNAGGALAGLDLTRPLEQAVQYHRYSVQPLIVQGTKSKV